MTVPGVRAILVRSIVGSEIVHHTIPGPGSSTEPASTKLLLTSNMDATTPVEDMATIEEVSFTDGDPSGKMITLTAAVACLVGSRTISENTDVDPAVIAVATAFSTGASEELLKANRHAGLNAGAVW